MIKLCHGCKLPFESRRDAKTCSAKCRKRISRLRQLAVEVTHEVGEEIRKVEHSVAESFHNLETDEAGFVQVADTIPVAVQSPPAQPQAVAKPDIVPVRLEPEASLESPSTMPEARPAPTPTVMPVVNTYAAPAQAVPNDSLLENDISPELSASMDSTQFAFEGRPTPPAVSSISNQPKRRFDPTLLKIAGAALVITLIVGFGTLFLTRNKQVPLAQNFPEQNLASTDEIKSLTSTLVPEGAELHVQGNGVFTGNLSTSGNLTFTQGNFSGSLDTADLTDNRTYQLPDASGTICLDSNNCGFASSAQLDDIASQLGQIAIPVIPPSTTLNGLGGAITLQGSTNQVSVSTGNGTITLNLPQDIAAGSSPTFGGLTLTDTLTLALNCTTFLNGGSLTTNASGQVICADDETSGAGTSVTTAGGTAGTIPIFTAADQIGDSIISQALGVVTISGDLVAGEATLDSLTLSGAGSDGSLQVASLGQATTFILPDPGMASVDICLSSGNCASGAPGGAAYVTVGNDAGLSGERAISPTGNLTGTDGGANGTYMIDTIANPTFTTSVTTPLLQSSGALAITPGGALTVGATGQTTLLQGSTTTLASNGAGNDIVLSSADDIRLSGFDCSANVNGGVLTTDASGNLVCGDDDGASGSEISGGGTANRIALFTGAQAVGDSWLLQNGSTLQIDNTRNLSLLGGNFDVNGTGTFSGLLSANGNFTVQTGDTFTINGDGFTDLTGTGLTISTGSLQTTLGTSVDLTTEVVSVLPVANGGTGVNGSTAANGQLLVGNGTGYTLANLTQGAGITVTNGTGSITVASTLGTSVETGEITDGTILEVDLNGSNAPTDDYVLTYDQASGGFTWVAPSGIVGTKVDSLNGLSGALTIEGVAGKTDITDNGTETITIDLDAAVSLLGQTIGNSEIENDAVQLGTQTTGNYQAGTSAGSGISVVGSAGEGWSPTIALGQLTADWNQTGAFDIVLNNSSSEVRILESTGATFFGTLDVGDLSADQTFTFLQGGTIITSGNVASHAVTSVVAGDGLITGGGPGAVTLDVGAGSGITVNANDIAVIYGSSTNTAVEGDTTLTCASGTGNLTGGGNSITLGSGGSCNSINTVANPTFSTSVTTPSLILTGAGSNGTLQLANLGQATVFTLPDPGVASADICLSTGNCAGTGGGITGAGTSGTLAVFTGSGSIGDSVLSQSGGNLTASGDLTLTGGTVSLGVASTTTGSLVLFNSGSTDSGTIEVTGLGQDTVFTLPDPGQATADICLSTGNCVGGGGGGAPNTAAYLTIGNDGTLSNERAIAVNTTNLSATDGGANGSYTINTIQGIATTSSPQFTGLTLTGNLDVQGTATVAGLATFNGGLTVQTGDTFTVNGDAFTDLTGTGLQVVGNALQATLGTAIDTSEITDGTILEADINATNAPTDDYVLTFDLASGGFTWVDPATLAGTAVDSLNSLTGALTLQGTANEVELADNGTDTITIGLPDDVTIGDELTVTGNVTVGANSTLRLTGGTTASRPGSPTEGMLYFDTDTDSLLVYSNGKWQADRAESVIVAANDSSQAEKDSADYVADGTADQTEINAALTEASGGKVYLLPGTYVANATILIPNNTTLAGSGRGTLIELADIDATDNLIENSDTTTGTGVVIQDLRLDGRDDLNTAGTQHGISFDDMGGGTGGTARQGAKLTNLWVNDFRSTGIFLSSSLNNTLTDNTAQGNGEYGFRLTSSSNNTLSGNISQGNGSMGIWLFTSSNNTFSGNISEGNTSHGILVNSNSSNNVFSGNIVQSNGTRGFSIQSGSSSNTISNNRIYNNGGSTDNNAIFIDQADLNNITNNLITDSSCTTTCYAINVSNSTSDNNYLADNTLGGGTINDAGTGTIYGGQLNASGDFVIQPASEIDLVANTNITGNLAVSGTTTTGALSVTNNATVGGTLGVTGLASFTALGTADTDTVLCRNSSNQLATCSSTFVTSGTLDDSAFVQGGNSFNETAILGTNDAFNLEFETAGTTRLTLDQSGDATLTGELTVQGTSISSIAGGLNVDGQTTFGNAPSVGNFYNVNAGAIFGTGGISTDCSFTCRGINSVITLDNPAGAFSRNGAAYFAQTNTGATAFTANNLYGVLIDDGTAGAGSTVTSNYGIYVGYVSKGTNDYGVYIGGGETYGLYVEDGSISYLGSFVGIGDTSPASMFTVGSGDRFQINSSGDITTAAGENLSITTGTTGTLTIDSGTTGSISIGTGANAKSVTVGNTTSTSSLTLTSGSGDVSIQSTDDINIGTTFGNDIVIGSTSGTASVAVQCGTGACSFGADSTGAHATTVGATTTTSSLLLQSGTGDVAIQSQDDINIGTNAVAQDIVIGNGTGATSVAVNCGTGACSFGADSSGAHTTTLGSTLGASGTNIQGGTNGINIGTGGISNIIQIGNTSGAVAQNINIGNNTTASSTNNVLIGSTIGTSTVTIQSGTGDIALQSQDDISIGVNAVSQDIVIGNSTGTTSVNVNCGSGACNFGTNATSHTTTVGSLSISAATVIQAGTSGVSLTTNNESTFSSGGVSIATGSSSAALGVAGTIAIAAGAGNLGGGYVNLTAGGVNAVNSYTGGTLSLGRGTTLTGAEITTLQGGTAGSAVVAAGGAVQVIGGTSNNTTAGGGAVTIFGGSALAGTVNGGAVNIDGGSSAGGTGGAISIGATNSRAITIGNATGATSVNVDAGSTGFDVDSVGSINIDSTSGNIGIGTDATAQSISIGNGGNTKAVTIGSISGTSSLTLQSGTGAINIGTGAQARAINIGTGAAAQTVTVGSTNSTSSLDLQSGTGTINIGTTAQARTINIGNQLGAVQTVSIGGISSTSSTDILSGTGGLSLASTGDVAIQSQDDINIGTNAVAQDITVGNTTGATSVTLQAGTGGIVVATLSSANTDTVLCRNSSNQIATCSSTFATGSGQAFLQSGNSFGATAVLGTNDANNLEFETAGTTRLTLDQSNVAYLGNGVTNTAPSGFTLQATGESGADQSNTGHLTIAGGQGTGTGNGSNIVFRYSPAGSAGSSLNTLQTACTISGTNGSLSCPGVGTRSERFGSGSLAAGDDAIAIGETASANNSESIALGRSSLASASGAIAIGYDATASGSSSIVIGRSASASNNTGTVLIGNTATSAGGGADNGVGIGANVSINGEQTVVIGRNAVGTARSVALGHGANTTGFQEAIVIGHTATATENNQLVIGAVNQQIETGYIGNGVTAAAPQDFVLNGTGGFGTNIQGADFTIAAGRSTGNALGGDIIFQTSDAGASGTTLRALSTKMIIQGNGNVGIGDTTPAAMLTVGNGDLFQVSSAGLVTYVNGTTNSDTLVCKNSSGQLAACSNAALTGTAFIQGGNSFGAQAVLGTNDTNSLAFETDGTTRWILGTDGHLLPNVDDAYDIGSDTARVRDLYLGPASLHIGTSTSDESILSYNTTSNSLIVKPATGNDSASAVQFQNAAGTGLLTVDTTNNKLIASVPIEATPGQGNVYFSTHTADAQELLSTGGWNSDDFYVVGQYGGSADQIIAGVLTSGFGFFGAKQVSSQVHEYGLLFDYTEGLLGGGGTGLRYSDGEIDIFGYGGNYAQFNGNNSSLDIKISESFISNISCSDTGGSLTAGTYYFKVGAENNGALASISQEASCTVTTGSTGSATINYDSVAGATGYRIYKGTSSDGQDRYFTDAGSPYTYTTDSGATLDSPSINTSDAVLARIGVSETYFNSSTVSFQNQTDSTAALSIQNASGTTLFNVDTSNAIISPGIASSTAATTQTATTLDSTNDVGHYINVAVGHDGLPVISYLLNQANADLKIVKCGNSLCNSGNVVGARVTSNDVGHFNDITVGTDGFPIVSYHDNSSQELEVLKCSRVDCSSGNSTAVVDTVAANTGEWTSIAIGKDGLPVISYYEVTNTSLKVAKCGNAACSSGNTTTTVDNAASVGQYTAIAVAPDGLPVISYYDADATSLKVTKCGNAACSSGNTTTTVDNAAAVGRFTSIAIGHDGLPVISYEDNSTADLKVTKCGNSTCSAGNVTTSIDTAGSISDHTGIAVGTDGLPVISYYESGNVKVAKCSNPSCSSNSVATVESTDDVGAYTDMVVGPDGMPFIAYFDNTNDNLMSVKCATASCAVTTGTALTSGVSLGSVVASWRSVYFDTLNLGKADARIQLNELGNFYANNLFSNADGNVGIGTNAPAHKFHIQAADGTATAVAKIETTGTDSVANFSLQNDARNWQIKVDGSNSDKFIIRDATGTQDRLIIDTSGNVGIGDTSPAAMLTVGNGDLFQVVSTGHVRTIAGSSTTPSYSFTSDTDTGMYSGGDNILLFSTGDSQKLTIDGTSTGGLRFNGGTGANQYGLAIQRGRDDTATRHLSLQNTSASTNLTQADILFQFTPSNGGSITTGAAILAAEETDWTTTTSTQDSYLSFRTALDGTVSERLRISSAGVTTVTGTLTVPGAGGSEQFGAGASAAGGNSLAVGNAASSAGTNNIAIGQNSSNAGGNDSVAVGKNASTGSAQYGVSIGASSASTGRYGVSLGYSALTDDDGQIAIGYSANSTTGTMGVAIGFQAVAANSGVAIGRDATNSTFSNSIALGNGATNTASNQFVLNNINTAYLGGVTHATPSGFTLQATGGSGSNIAGASLTLAGGQGTGTGVGGNIVFQYAPAGSTGSSLNALQTACSISGTNGSLSCPGGGTGSQRFGLNASTGTNLESLAVGQGATVQGWTSIAIGYNATTGSSAQGSTAVGHNSSTTAQNGTAIGASATAGNGAVALGSGSTASTNEAVALGGGATAAFVNSIALGNSATTTTTNQLVVGGSTGINDAYFGNGVTAASPSNVTLNATGGSGTNITGANIAIASGRGTGSAVGGDILFRTSADGASGTTLRNLVTNMTIKGGTGNVGIGDTSPDFKFEVQGSSGSGYLGISNASDGDILSVTSSGELKVGTTAAVTLTNAKLLVTIAEVTTSLRIGDGTNGVSFNDGVSNKLRLRGTARNDMSIALKPEFEGAILRPDGGSNTGFMTSEFCSGSSLLSINTGVCAASDEHTYYEWTTAEASAQDYDIYVRWKVPSDFDNGSLDAGSLNVYGWRTDTTNNSVLVTMFNNAGAQCGASQEAGGSAGAWSNLSFSFATNNAGCDAIDAGEYVTFRIKMTADVSDVVRLGEIEINYKSTF